MFRFALFYSVLFIPVFLFSQNNASITNQYAFGGTSDDYAFKMIDDGTGYLIGGSSKSGISGDKTEACRGLFDIWLLKTDYTFNIQWQKTIGGNQDDYLIDMVQMADGGCMLLSWSNSGASGDKTIPNYGVYDYWVIKINSIGSIQWQKTYGGENTSYSSALGIKAVSDNQYVLYGSTDSDSAGIKTENNNGIFDQRIICIDSVGNVQWEKSLGGNYGDDSRDCHYDSNTQTLFFCGTTASDISGDITQMNFGIGIDILLSSFNAVNGQIKNNWRYGGDKNDGGLSILNAGSRLYIIGASCSDSSGLKSEDNRSIDSLDYDFWIVKTDLNGNFLQDKTIGANKYEFVFDGKSVDNQIIICGYSNSGISGEKTEMCKGLSDYWIVSLDTNLNILWQKVIGGNDEEIPRFIHTVAPNKYIIGGGSKSGVSGNKTIPSRGGDDFWILEISTTMSIEDFSQQRLHAFPNPVADFVTVELPENSTSGQLYVFDITGAIVHSEIINAESNQVNLSNLASGVYFISYFDESGNGWSAEVQKM